MAKRLPFWPMALIWIAVPMPLYLWLIVHLILG